MSIRQAVRIWTYIGINSFGGPAGQIAVMHRELVDRQRWISEGRFLHALNYCMVLPGPEAQQLATYIGWLMNGVRGGVAAGVLFVIPGFVAMMALSVAYALYGQVTWVSGLLAGLQAAVVALVVEAMIRVGRRSLRSPFLRAVAATAFVLLSGFLVAFPFVIIGAAALGWFVGRVRSNWIPAAGMRAAGAPVDDRPYLLPDDEAVPPGAARRARLAALACLVMWLTPVIVLVALLGTDNIFTQEGLLFSKTAVLTFGGAYAILAYVAQQAVQVYGWVTPADMVTGLGLAETTPGPLIMVVQFVGFLAAYNNPGSLPPLVAGVLGAVLSVWVTFLPCFFFIFIGAPYLEQLRHNVALRHALAGIGAAVVGVILNLALFFALNTAFATVNADQWGPLDVSIPDLSTVRWDSVAISVLAAVLIFRLKVPTLAVLAVCACLGSLLAIIGL